MPTYGWILIALGVVLLYFIYRKVTPLVKSGLSISQSINHILGSVSTLSTYTTDIAGLVGSFDSSNDPNGSFTSRLGDFFGSTATD